MKPTTAEAAPSWLERKLAYINRCQEREADYSLNVCPCKLCEQCHGLLTKCPICRFQFSEEPEWGMPEGDYTQSSSSYSEWMRMPGREEDER